MDARKIDHIVTTIQALESQRRGIQNDIEFLVKEDEELKRQGLLPRHEVSIRQKRSTICDINRKIDGLNAQLR
ncbi:MAG: hypothetical protein FWH52_05640 [Synergistaceae bacterium]|nr:hypothetical protein [Synergistaceae bacterium]